MAVPQTLRDPDPKSARGCYRPIRMRQVEASTRATTLEGQAIYVRCGTRHEAKCAACAERYRRDAITLIESGVAKRKRPGQHLLFVTLTAPGASFFGSPSHRRAGDSGKCPCGATHPKDDPVLGAPLDARRFRYDLAARWNASMPELWRRFVIALERSLPSQSIAYVKVVEAQRRGLFHVHAVVRVSPVDGGTPVSAAVVTNAVKLAAMVPDVDGMKWGAQVDVKVARNRPPARRKNESEDHYKRRVRQAMTRNTFARYLAKYATKGPEHAIRKGSVGPKVLRHHERLRAAATVLADAWLADRRAAREVKRQALSEVELCEMYESDVRAELVWATRARHTVEAFGYGGQFLTKSQNYSITFKQLRQRQQDFARSKKPNVVLSVEHVWEVEGYGVLPWHQTFITEYWRRHLSHKYDPPEFPLF